MENWSFNKLSNLLKKWNVYGTRKQFCFLQATGLAQNSVVSTSFIIKSCHTSPSEVSSNFSFSLGIFLKEFSTSQCLRNHTLCNNVKKTHRKGPGMLLCIHSYNSHSWIRKCASLAFTGCGGRNRGEEKRKSAYRPRKKEEPLIEQPWARGHFRSKESFIKLEISDHGECKEQGGKYNLHGFAFVCLCQSSCFSFSWAHLLPLLRRKEGPLEFPSLHLLKKKIKFLDIIAPWYTGPDPLISLLQTQVQDQNCCIWIHLFLGLLGPRNNGKPDVLRNTEDSN